MQYVYVLNKHGEPLMPCSPRKARLLMKEKKATVAKRTPFTIRLRYGSSGYRQQITLGVDAGSKHIGMSACTETRELLTLFPCCLHAGSCDDQGETEPRDIDRRDSTTACIASTKDGLLHRSK